jgi:RNA polymerase sigma-70 factor (ECF subfamily)
VSDDEQVARLVTAGNMRQAATLVIQAHGPAVLRYLRALLRDEDTVGDAFSLFGEWVWRGIANFRGEAPLRPWALGVAWNAAQRVRDEAWHKHRERLSTGFASRLVAKIRTISPETVERRADSLGELRQELAAEDQNLLVLRLDQGLAWVEIAVVLSGSGPPVKPAALRKRFERLKERMAQRARERGLLGGRA